MLSDKNTIDKFLKKKEKTRIQDSDARNKLLQPKFHKKSQQNSNLVFLVKNNHIKKFQPAASTQNVTLTNTVQFSNLKMTTKEFIKLLLPLLAKLSLAFRKEVKCFKQQTLGNLKENCFVKWTGLKHLFLSISKTVL